MGIGTKLTLMGAGTVLLATLLMATAGMRGNAHMTRLATEKVKASIEDGLRTTAAGSRNMANCLDQSVGSKAGRSKELRKTIMQTMVGKTGYVWVLGGEGAKKGHYIISKDGMRDGENIWNTKDANDSYCIQDMINGAKSVPAGESFIYRYAWINPGESAPRQKIAAVTYYEPWGWVIGAACYEDELYSVAELKANARTTLISLIVAALVALATGSFVVRLYAQKISRQLQHLTKAADALSMGDVDKASAVITSRAA